MKTPAEITLRNVRVLDQKFAVLKKMGTKLCANPYCRYPLAPEGAVQSEDPDFPERRTRWYCAEFSADVCDLCNTLYIAVRRSVRLQQAHLDWLEEGHAARKLLEGSK